MYRAQTWRKTKIYLFGSFAKYCIWYHGQAIHTYFSSGTFPPVLKGHWRLELRQLLKLLPIRNSNELRLTDSIDRLNLNLKKLRYDRREPQLVLCRSVQTSQFNFRAELHHGALNYCRSSLRFSALMKP